jgi:hypothetical protein
MILVAVTALFFWDAPDYQHGSKSCQNSARRNLEMTQSVYQT